MSLQKQKGIYKHKNRWRARLWIPEQGEIYLGHYRSKEDAALAFDRAAIALRTYEKASKQGLNYSKDIYKEEYKMLEVRTNPPQPPPLGRKTWKRETFLTHKLSCSSFSLPSLSSHHRIMALIKSQTS